MQWEMILLLNLAAPFVAYYLVRDRIEEMKKRRAAARSKS
jgi:hypothetical protein